jgi:hypothetical protein
MLEEKRIREMQPAPARKIKVIEEEHIVLGE